MLRLVFKNSFLTYRSISPVVALESALKTLTRFFSYSTILIWIKTFFFSPFKTVSADLTSFENSFIGQKIFSSEKSLLDEKLSSSSTEEKDQNNNRDDALLEKSPEQKTQTTKTDLEITSFDPDMTLMQAMLSWKFISSVIFFMFMTLRYVAHWYNFDRLQRIFRVPFLSN